MGHETEQLHATVRHIVWRNAVNGWSVLSCDFREGGRDERVTGSFPGIREGAELEMTGHWDRHPKHGRHFACESWQEVMPSGAEAIRKYLASGQVEGIGPILADRLVDAFGASTFEVIERQPERLRDIPGIGKKKAASVVSHWEDHRAIRDIMVFLKGHDITNNLAAKIYNRYGAESIDILTRTPYRIAYDIRGVGFRRADDLASRLGVDRNDPERLKCGLLYALDKSRTTGNMYLPREALMKAAAAPDIFGNTCPPRENLETALATLLEEGSVSMPDKGEGEDAVYIPAMLKAEVRAARALADLSQHHTDLHAPVAEAAGGTQYAKQQIAAIRMAASAGCCIITGGPGTGKTTTVKGIITTLEGAGKTVILASPTGKAAKRLEEATGHKAATIHRLLEWNPAECVFKRNEQNPLEGDVLIVDETSMVDNPLLDRLMKAVPEKMHVVLVGDSDQLPSVGPGNCLHDMLSSGMIPTIRLNTIFRQALDSDIIRGAHAINEGHMPDTSKKQDLWFAARESPAAVTDTIIKWLAEKKAEGLDLSTVQVLSPRKGGECGTEELNRRIQNLVNPDGKPVVRGFTELRIGDRVINTRNNYTFDIFNGDQGVIVADDEESGTFLVDFDGNLVPFRTTDADDLIHAWAITVHRAQGSEFDRVIVALSSSHSIMLQRQILYTAVTRAKKLCWIVGDKEALSRAVRTNTMRHRSTRLSQYIVAEAANGESIYSLPQVEDAADADPFGGIFD